MSLFLVNNESTPSFADAKSYIDMALVFRNKGFLYDLGNLRTYGYPSILSLISYVSNPSPAGIKTAAGVIQSLSYLVCTMWLSYEINKFNRLLASAVAVGLLANILIMPLIVDTLTEAPSLIILIILVVSILKASRSGDFCETLLWFGVGNLLSFFDLVIRPANIVVIPAWIIVSVVIWWGRLKGSPSRVFALICVAFASTGISLGPQILHNFHHYGSFSPLPVGGVGGLQVYNGVRWMKYATMVSGTGASSVPYLNPLYNGAPIDSGALRWYVDFPFRGMGTVLLHLINSFSFDYIFVYIPNLTPWYSKTLEFSVWLLSIIGVYQIVKFLSSSRRGSSLDSRWSISLFCFMSAICIDVGMINAVSAVESRYNIVPVTLLIICAVYGLMRPLRTYTLRTCVGSAIFAAISLLGMGISEWAKNYSAEIMEAKAATHTLSCGQTWKASTVPPATGFDVKENDGIGSFRWMVNHIASIVVLPCPGPMKVTIQIAFAITSEAISHLEIDLAGKPLNASLSQDASGVLLTAHSGSLELDRNQPVDLTLKLPKLDKVAGDPREFGVAVRSITIDAEER